MKNLSMISLYLVTILAVILAALSEEGHHSIEAVMLICTTFIVETMNSKK